jgi:hypothetical protein
MHSLHLVILFSATYEKPAHNKNIPKELNDAYNKIKELSAKSIKLSAGTEVGIIYSRDIPLRPRSLRISNLGALILADL